MFADIKANCKDWDNKEEICAYLNKILDKQAFDGAGLIYGMGHAVYTNSDPREVILKSFAKNLSVEKGMEKEYALYETVEKEAGQLIMNKEKCSSRYVPMSISTVDLYIQCLVFQKKCLLLCSQQLVFQAGVLIVLKSLSMQERLFVLLISM